MAVTIKIASVTQNSQSVANNTSNVTVKVTASWTGGSWNHTGKANGWVKIDGVQYSFSNVILNKNKSTTGTQTLITKTVDVKHNADGTKTLNVSASFVTGVSSETVTNNMVKPLTTIPRQSALTVSNGTLGTPMTLKISKASDVFGSTITYKCGSASGTITTKTNSTSISWTPPLSLASQNTTGSSVSISITLTTYFGDTLVGSSSKSITCAIPNISDTSPSCTVSVTDITGYDSTYGNSIKNLSRFKVDIEPHPAYGSPITTYSTTIGSKTYTGKSFTTDPVDTHGLVYITTTVTDKRGYTGGGAEIKQVADYTAPAVTEMTVRRCSDALGQVQNDQGEYVLVTFSAAVTSLNGRNTAQYEIKYKQSTSEVYNAVKLTDYDDVFSPVDAKFVFSAEAGNSYDIELDVTDEFQTAKRVTSVSTAFTIMHWNADGTGMAIGKISELSGVFDVGMKTKFSGGRLYSTLEVDTDLNDVLTPNNYVGANTATYNYANCPLESGTFVMTVESGGEDGQVRQLLTRCHKTEPRTFERWYYASTWGDWMETTPTEFVLYNHATTGSATAITLAETCENFKYLEIFFTDNNGYGKGYTKVYMPNGTNAPRIVELSLIEASSAENTVWRRTRYTLSGTSCSPNTTTAGYVQYNGTTNAINKSSGTNYIRIYRVVGIR